jgi:hypothetical protein
MRCEDDNEWSKGTYKEGSHLGLFEATILARLMHLLSPLTFMKPDSFRITVTRFTEMI